MDERDWAIQPLCMITFLQVLHRRHTQDININRQFLHVTQTQTSAGRWKVIVCLYFSFFLLKKKVNYTGPNEPQNHLLCSWLLFIFITGWIQDFHFSAKCSAVIFGDELSVISMSVEQLQHVCFRSEMFGSESAQSRTPRADQWHSVQQELGLLPWQHQHHLPSISPPLYLLSKAAMSHHFPHTGVPVHCTPVPLHPISSGDIA